MSVAGDTGPYRDHASRDQALHLGVWVFLGSETLLFAGLFGLYAAQRTEHAAAFHEAAAHNQVWVGTVNTIVLLVSSFFVAWAVHMVRSDRPRAALLSLGGTVLLGLTFLGLKAYEYAHHLSEGFAPGVAYANEELTSGGARMFFTLYYAMTGLHALHVIAGLAIIGVIAVGVRRRRVDAARPTLLELGGLYWHLVDVVWIFLWPLLYLSA